MLVAMLVLPIVNIKWDRNNRQKNENRIIEKYKKYLREKANVINSIKEKQRAILLQNYLSVAECLNVISKQNTRLWERQVNDEDFLSVRIGIGKVPLNINLEYPQEKFRTTDDDLINVLNEIVEQSKLIDNAPVTVSLKNNKISAIIAKDKDFLYKYLKNIILQLITFHDYINLKLVFLVSETNSEEFAYVKELPHIWDNTKQIRFFADNYNDMNEISKILMEEIITRKKENEENQNNTTTQYLIITDDYKSIERLSFIEELKNIEKDLGFSFLCISDEFYKLPSNCRTFISVEDQQHGTLYNQGVNIENQTKLEFEPLVTIFYEIVAKKLFNIPIRVKQGTTSLPNSLAFLEMYNVGNVEQLEVEKRWKTNDSTLSLKAPVGIDSNGMIVYLDAHEKFHGPHGLIAGSTGSGKSEFIITYILSLAINYHPDDVSFLLIDYKGGGLAGAFEKNNIKLPHIAGTITNIDKNGLNRSLTSIQSELKRRQKIFNEARNITNESTMDIYKYQRLYHEHVVSIPVPHIFIICDEFAELKQQQVEFMDELISVSRIGRSLGVHLILATQKPNGVVDDQIRSNIRFGVCLKVQEPLDSLDVIDRKDAAYLKRPGQFYLNVGQNEYFILGQSGYAGEPYIPSLAPLKKIDTSIEFVSNTGMTLKKIDNKKVNVDFNTEEQITAILRNIYEVSNKLNVKSKTLWLPDISENTYVNDLRNKYKLKTKTPAIETVIGEYDAPSEQKQDLVKIDITKKENVIVFGNEKSGKETLFSTMIYDLITNYSPKEVQMYIFDFGTEALKIFKGAPHIGDIVFMGDEEKIETFFQMIQRTIRDRIQTLSDYNGDRNIYVSKGNTMPIMLILINNYEAFVESTKGKYDEVFSSLTREGLKAGIVFCISSSSPTSMRYRLSQNFNKRIALQLNEDSEYYSVFENIHKKRPTQMFGRGLVLVENEIYEYQTAKICEHVDYVDMINNTISGLKKKYNIVAKPIPILPKKIEISFMQQYLKDISKIPLGIVKHNKDIYYYDLKNNFVTLIVAKNKEQSIEYMKCLTEEIQILENIAINILNTETIEEGLEKEYSKFIEKNEKSIKEKKNKFVICVIVGISKLIEKNIIYQDDLNELLKNYKNSKKCSIILVDNPDSLEDYTFEEWYENFVPKDNGIWVGNGIEKQTLISKNFSIQKLDNNCGNSYGYAINEGIPTFIKLVGISEGEVENE